MKKNTVKKIIIFSGATLAVAYAGLSAVAKSKKPDSIYEEEPEQKNPFEGKMVQFVEDEADKMNADGVCGHLEAVGPADVTASAYQSYLKPAIDRLLSFGGLVALSPVYAALVLAIKIDDPGPVFFVQKRVGQNKQFFKVHKFRSMKMCTPHDIPTHMLDNPEQYITRVGKFMRKYSLDELPQIWDIFLGNMSVIGPRPALWNQDILTAERDKYGANNVKPGLTGWAQINGRDELEIPVKASFDGEYAKNQSLLFDAKCFFGTIKKVFDAEGVVEGGTGEIKKEALDAADASSEKVSIITPAYNAAKCLEETVQSVIAQTHSNWELIIVDDCSTDGTYELACSLAAEDARILVLRNEKNAGVAATRNRGLEAASGNFIAFLDSDDLWLPQKLEKQLQYMLANRCALTYTAYQKFDTVTGERGKIIRAPKKMTAKKIYGDTSIGCLTVMVNRGMTGPFQMPPLSHTEDNVTWQQILARGFTAYGLNEVLALYREGNVSLTGNKKKAALQQWHTYRDYYGFSPVKSAFYFALYSFNAVKKHFF